PFVRNTRERLQDILEAIQHIRRHTIIGLLRMTNLFRVGASVTCRLSAKRLALCQRTHEIAFRKFRGPRLSVCDMSSCTITSESIRSLCGMSSRINWTFLE